MTQSAVDQLEQGKKRLESLTTRRTRVQVQLEAGRQQLAEARAEAEAAYGTSDLAKLKDILAQQEAGNTAALTEFLGAVGEFETFITKIEEALANPAAMASLLAAMPETAGDPVTPAVKVEEFASEDI